MNPQALNRYSYVLNNPLKYVDPSGHSGLLAALTRIIGELIGYGVTEAAGANVSGTSFDEFLCSMDPRTQEYWQNLVLYGATAGIGSYTFGSMRGALNLEKSIVKSNFNAKLVAQAARVELKSGSLGARDTRLWYLSQLKQIPNKIDTTLPLEQQARQAFELRNSFKAEARDLMNNRQMADYLDTFEPAKTWEQMIQTAIKKGYKDDAIYQYIVDASQRGNKGINQLLGIMD